MVLLPHFWQNSLEIRTALPGTQILPGLNIHQLCGIFLQSTFFKLPSSGSHVFVMLTGLSRNKF